MEPAMITLDPHGQPRGRLVPGCVELKLERGVLSPAGSTLVEFGITATLARTPTFESRRLNYVTDVIGDLPGAAIGITHRDDMIAGHITNGVTSVTFYVDGSRESWAAVQALLEQTFPGQAEPFITLARQAEELAREAEVVAGAPDTAEWLVAFAEPVQFFKLVYTLHLWACAHTRVAPDPGELFGKYTTIVASMCGDLDPDTYYGLIGAITDAEDSARNRS